MPVTDLRRFLRRAILAALIVTLIPGALLAWAVLIEPDLLVVRDISLELPEAPPALNGLKIAVLADIHAGALHIDREKLEAVVARTNASGADLVVVLGDFTINGPGHRSGMPTSPRFMTPEQTATVLRGLYGPLGTYVALGNHDWWYDGRRVRQAFEEVGQKVLDDEVIRLERHGYPFWLAGLADVVTRTPDVTETLAKVPAGQPIIAMTHNPDLFPEIPPRVNLTLAGHTHGGQVRLPMIGRPIVPSKFGQRYASGHIVEGGQHLFVTPGIGTSIIPVRFGVPPEISVVTLRTRW